jgi:bifunctional enzyme CysN/CysC
MMEFGRNGTGGLEQADKDLLRFITCGSVDDGKSTLIGRLLYETGSVPLDDLRAAEAASRGEIDYSLLVDGLSAEREQGITIDVAYRFFATPRRKFIVADTPGHEQYTRNMVTGASTAQAAVLLVDARKGLLTQTRRHSYLAKLLGIRHFILAVSKMDLVSHSSDVFDAICADFRVFAGEIGIDDWAAIPLSGRKGDNVAARSAAMPWYDGPPLLGRLEALPTNSPAAGDVPFRMPVQLVVRPDQDFRGYAGLIASGAIAPGAEVRILPSGRTTSVTRIVTAGGDLAVAGSGQAVTLTFADQVDCSRGDVIAAASEPPQAADQFEATIVWLGEEELLPGRGYWLKLATQTVTATVQQPKYEINVNSLEHLAAKTLGMNGIGVAEIATDREIVFEPYDVNRTLGGFILIDKLTNATVGAGMIHFALRRALNVHRQHLEISRETHAALKGQKPAVLWFTGLSGAGKSTIANLVEKRLVAMGRHTFLLDGDNVRHGLNRDLGFTDADRIENIRRIGEVACLMADAGLIVLTAFISPFRAEREMVRKMLPEGEFIEIFVDTSIKEAERRDPKGLYAKARAGEIKNFTGIDSPYEPPEEAEIRIDTTRLGPEDAADRIVEALVRRS